MNIPYGMVDNHSIGRKNDYLYRLSLKAVIINNEGNVLVVKEDGRDYWDLPGGGMDHDETIQTALARELQEEAGFNGDFTYNIIAVEEPVVLKTVNVWQVRLIFHIIHNSANLELNIDQHKASFVDPAKLEQSSNEIERRVAAYARSAIL